MSYQDRHLDSLRGVCFVVYVENEHPISLLRGFQGGAPSLEVPEVFAICRRHHVDFVVVTLEERKPLEYCLPCFSIRNRAVQMFAIAMGSNKCRPGSQSRTM